MITAKRIFFLVMFIGTTVAVPAHAANCAKNPGHPQCQSPPPPPPPPDGADCQDADGVFPAFAYKEETVTVKGRKRQYTTDIFVANSAGDCSIKLFTADYHISELDYTQRDDGNGRIVWQRSLSDYATIEMLEFLVTNKAITSSLPAIASSVFTDFDRWLSQRVNISHDGNTILSTSSKHENDDLFTIRINISDVSNCISNCPTTIAREFLNESVGWFGLAINAAGNRVYFAASNSDNDVHRLSFIANQGGVWSDPIDVVTSEDPDYLSRSFRELDVGVSPSSGEEVVAVHYEENGVQTGVKVLNTGACTVDPLRIGSCYAANLSSELGQIPFLALPTFTNIPFGDTAVPGLAVQTFANGQWILYIADPDTFALELVSGMPNERLAIGN